VIFGADNAGRRRICVRPRHTHTVGRCKRPRGLGCGKRGAFLHLRLRPRTVWQRMTVVSHGAQHAPQSARLVQRHTVLREGQRQDLRVVRPEKPSVARAVVQTAALAGAEGERIGRAWCSGCVVSPAIMARRTRGTHSAHLILPTVTGIRACTYSHMCTQQPEKHV
jgi:hypothetical protein